VKSKVEALCAVTSYSVAVDINVSEDVAASFHLENGSNIVLRNVSVLPQHYTASQSRREFWK